MLDDNTIINIADVVLAIEAEAIAQLRNKINISFVKACKLLLLCQGRVIIIGIGKSGHISNKLAATLASTGTPAFFVHPAEAHHGDMGMITPKDIVLAISNSGETNELLVLLPLIKRLGVPLIAMTGRPESTLAKRAEVHIDVSVEREACPLGLSPTSSTTAALAMGDALAVALLEMRGFTAKDFAYSHPGGQLGRRLLLLIDDIMHVGNQIPHSRTKDSLKEALIEMSSKGLGTTIIVNQYHHVIGIFTDGDLRRALDKQINIHSVTVGELMTYNCQTIASGKLAVEALKIMQQFKITTLPVVNTNKILVGVVNMHDLLHAGVI